MFFAQHNALHIRGGEDVARHFDRHRAQSKSSLQSNNYLQIIFITFSKDIQADRQVTQALIEVDRVPRLADREPPCAWLLEITKASTREWREDEKSKSNSVTLGRMPTICIIFMKNAEEYFAKQTPLSASFVKWLNCLLLIRQQNQTKGNWDVLFKCRWKKEGYLRSSPKIC